MKPTRKTGSRNFLNPASFPFSLGMVGVLSLSTAWASLPVTLSATQSLIPILAKLAPAPVLPGSLAPAPAPAPSSNEDCADCRRLGAETPALGGMFPIAFPGENPLAHPGERDSKRGINVAAVQNPTQAPAMFLEAPETDPAAIERSPLIQALKRMPNQDLANPYGADGSGEPVPEFRPSASDLRLAPLLQRSSAPSVVAPGWI